MLLELARISIPPGQKILLQEITWPEFETILTELGEHRSARIAYNNGTLEIMTPLPEHEIDKVLIGDLIKAILEELEIEFYPLGSTTFKNPLTQKGLEPDDCFSIANEAKVRGKTRLDLTMDPPPDLAVEIDVTVRTHLSIYASLGVKEVWRFEQGKLQINSLEGNIYREVEISPTFPQLPILEVIPQYLAAIKIRGRNQTMKAFRAWLRGQINQ